MEKKEKMQIYELTQRNMDQFPEALAFLLRMMELIFHKKQKQFFSKSRDLLQAAFSSKKLAATNILPAPKNCWSFTLTSSMKCAACF